MIETSFGEVRGRSRRVPRRGTPRKGHGPSRDLAVRGDGRSLEETLHDLEGRP